MCYNHHRHHHHHHHHHYHHHNNFLMYFTIPVFYGHFILCCLTEGATYPVAPRSRPYCSMQMMQNMIYLLNTVREWHWLLTVTEFISVTALQCSIYVRRVSKRLVHQNQAQLAGWLTYSILMMCTAGGTLYLCSTKCIERSSSDCLLTTAPCISCHWAYEHSFWWTTLCI